MSKHKYKLNVSFTCITIPIETDEYLEKFILDNSFMRNHIRNDFAEEANKYKGRWNKYKDFNPRKFKTYYFNEIEELERRYDYYCVGLSKQVANDFKKAIKTIRTKNSKIIENAIKNHIPLSEITLGEFHYKRFNYNRYSFKVDLLSSYNGRYYSKLNILDDKNLVFRVRSNKYGRPKEYLSIKLKESLYDDVLCNSTYIRHYTSNGYTNECTFTLEDIKEISFKYDCGHYYIQLSINASYIIDKKSLKYSKDNICGIDTGIRHPVTLYDGKNILYLSMDDKTTRKIHYLERRIRRLQHYKDIKYNYNEKHGLSTHSNNIIKLSKKISKLYRKITNIKKFWIQNRCKEIATTYSKICVDTFEQPGDDESEGFKELPNILKRKINYANRFHNMYYFNEFLKHDCIKYGCEYVKSPEDTTRTCSICGYVNDHLLLKQTHLRCANCNNVIERDMNAAQNCYDYVSNM